ncbi:amino acid ABC transporter ATP-binding protein [Spirochaetia bacterium]|nr:amino acid ABC transporter ATP-binding protein [Spirochaetia bacterium]
MIQVKGVSKSFQHNVVLDDISVDIPKGDVVALIGSSGAGKSTFLRSINCLEQADKGSIRLGELFVDFAGITKKERLTLRQQTAMVFQQFNLFYHRTALDNIKEGLIVVKKLGEKEATEIAREKLAQVGLSDREDYYPRHLSGGQQQRIGIARALAMDPQLMLLDEPTSALDPELVGEVLSTITQTAAAGQTMLLVSHEMNFVYRVATKVLFLDNGKIIEQGTPKQVFYEPQCERTREFLSTYFKDRSPEYAI